MLTGVLSSAQRWVDVAFSEPIAEQFFTPADVKLRGPRPDGQVDDIQVLSFRRFDDTHYRLSFVPQYVNGTYTLQIGPNVLDLAGNAMDQNRDLVLGQDPEDRYEGTFPGPSTTFADRGPAAHRSGVGRDRHD